MKTFQHYRKISTLNFTFISGMFLMCLGYWWVSPSPLKIAEFYERSGNYSNSLIYYEKIYKNPTLKKEQKKMVLKKLLDLYRWQNKLIPYLNCIIDYSRYETITGERRSDGSKCFQLLKNSQKLSPLQIEKFKNFFERNL